MSKFHVAFSTTLTIQALHKFPLSNTKIFVKIKPPSGEKLFTSIKTAQNETVVWNESFQFNSKIELQKNSLLADSVVRLSIRQPDNSNGFIRIGIVNINLAVMANKNLQNPRRYILENAKINTLLIVQVQMIPLFYHKMNHRIQIFICN
ncbi:MAG: hypothetical protein EZS28_027431 [Streblomastix strix]|uniref:C2 NT-type domain-containing protein n=1 Tax=Streblomastix strix TaxID=222440 RepID=A0A5J4V3H9_9EUKA|nr:MAG: hypothetical protein EZS28_027431 [Streblomastix strix]